MENIGSIIVGLEEKGYKVLDVCTVQNAWNTRFILVDTRSGHAERFVSWQILEGNTYFGHYHNDLETATKDLQLRVKHATPSW